MGKRIERVMLGCVSVWSGMDLSRRRWSGWLGGGADSTSSSLRELLLT